MKKATIETSAIEDRREDGHRCRAHRESDPTPAAPLHLQLMVQTHPGNGKPAMTRWERLYANGVLLRNERKIRTGTPSPGRLDADEIPDLKAPIGTNDDANSTSRLG